MCHYYGNLKSNERLHAFPPLSDPFLLMSYDHIDLILSVAYSTLQFDLLRSL